MEHYDRFNQCIEETGIVSNREFSFKLADGTDCRSKATINCNELSKIEIEKACAKISNQFGKDVKSLRATTFQTSPLSVEIPSDKVKSELSSYIDNNFIDHTYRISPIYNTVLSELDRKAAISADFDDYDSLISAKGITKNQFISTLTQFLQIEESHHRLWDNIESELKNEKVPFRERQKIKKEWRLYKVLLSDRQNVYLPNASKEIHKILSTHDFKAVTFQKQVEEAYKNIPANQLIEDYIIRCIIYEWLISQ